MVFDLEVPDVKIVVATRVDASSFLTETALGKSLQAMARKLPRFKIRIFANNTQGLPVIYNTVINESKDDPSILVFIHDDAYICDFFLRQSLVSGLDEFEIIGLAGNKRRVPRQPSWAFVDDKFTWDRPENLSGSVGHGTGITDYKLSSYGESSQEVKLLDGLLIACHSNTLLSNDIWFDERFDFHFYDLDFCRQAETKGLKMGTWPISVIHESGGAFGSPPWKESYAKYVEKWVD